MLRPPPPAPPPLRRERGGLWPPSRIVGHLNAGPAGAPALPARTPMRLSFVGISRTSARPVGHAPDHYARTNLAPPSRVGKGDGGLGPAVGGAFLTGPLPLPLPR
jgi:hypothetical protein